MGAPVGTTALDMLFRIPVNARIALQPVGSAARLWSSLVGVIRGRHVLVTPPASVAERDMLRAGTSVTVRFLATGNTIGVFTTEVAWVNVVPTNILFLRYPEKIKVVCPRASVRAMLVAPCQVAVGEIAWPAIMIDLSGGGCRVSVDLKDSTGQGLAVGGKIAVRFAMPGMDSPIVAAAIIRSTRTKGDKMAMGLQFAGLAEGVRHSLERYSLEAAAYAAA